MCGIALIFSGVRLNLSLLHVDARSPSLHPVHEQVSHLLAFKFYDSSISSHSVIQFVIIWINFCGANSILGLYDVLFGYVLILVSFSCFSSSFL